MNSFPESFKGRSNRENYTQTENSSSAENSSQIPERQNIEAQTDAVKGNENIYGDFHVDTLLTFLRKVTPLICSVLEKNSKSKAFDRYKLLSDVESTSISCLHVLEKALASEFCCSSISWNSVGTAIAAAYPFQNII
ncbi:hypothetical protein CEXT_98321 [Caerostris extrusa]|uniref:Uncharacterized protein n=1 Tax=Caerostris extrusa TaxID=172846 RepID=A0AAV4QMW3_CAEEX|nr:hypothetical protein CEXT_98321 [Caerostris extrusa]